MNNKKLTIIIDIIKIMVSYWFGFYIADKYFSGTFIQEIAFVLLIFYTLMLIETFIKSVINNRIKKKL